MAPVVYVCCRPEVDATTGAEKAKGKRRRTALSDLNVSPTAEDERLVVLLTRYRYSTAALLHRYVFPERARSTVYARLRRLEAAGLVAHRRVLEGMDALYYVTPAGYQWVGSTLPAKPDWSLTQVRHGIMITQVGLKFESQGLDVLTEREVEVALRAAQRARKVGSGEYRPLIGAGAVVDLEDRSDPDPWTRQGADMRYREHAPDLVIRHRDVTSGTLTYTGVEVECTRKRDSEIRSIIKAYRREKPLWTKVIYVAMGRDVTTQVARIRTEEHVPVDALVIWTDQPKTRGLVKGSDARIEALHSVPYVPDANRPTAHQQRTWNAA